MSKKLDPTNQGITRKRALKTFKARIALARDRVIELIEAKAQEAKAININERFWQYEIDPSLSGQIETIFNQELETELNRLPFNWWYSEQVNPAWRSGVMDENNTLEQIFTGTIVLMGIDFLFNRLDGQYINELNRSYQNMRSFSQRNAASVYQELQNALDAGEPKTKVIKRMRERFTALAWQIRRFNNTEISRINNNARLAAIVYYRDTQDLPLKVQHISALLETTRPHHAERHKRVYTPEQQLRWWNEGANRINCRCVAKAVKVDESGNILETNKLKSNGSH